MMTGDGTNDVDALQRAHASVALPSDPDGGNTIHALVAAAASVPPCHHAAPLTSQIHSTADFWACYTAGTVVGFGAGLWRRLWAAVRLLAIKQSATAGVVLAAAAHTGMDALADPFFPAQYQVI
jgi:magnesium-transporting ATPase (P-type)